MLEFERDTDYLEQLNPWIHQAAIAWLEGEHGWQWGKFSINGNVSYLQEGGITNSYWGNQFYHNYVGYIRHFAELGVEPAVLQAAGKLSATGRAFFSLICTLQSPIDNLDETTALSFDILDDIDIFTHDVDYGSVVGIEGTPLDEAIQQCDSAFTEPFDLKCLTPVHSELAKRIMTESFWYFYDKLVGITGAQPTKFLLPEPGHPSGEIIPWTN